VLNCSRISGHTSAKPSFRVRQCRSAFISLGKRRAHKYFRAVFTSMPAFVAAISCGSSVFDYLYSFLICWSVNIGKALSQERFPHGLNSLQIGRNNCRRPGTSSVADHAGVNDCAVLWFLSSPSRKLISPPTRMAKPER